MDIDLSKIEPGIYIEGHWGIYGLARMVEIAEGLGYEDKEIIDIAKKHLHNMWYINDSPLVTEEEEQTLQDAADEVEAWLNENASDENHSWGWFEGEFFYWSTQTWEESY